VGIQQGQLAVVARPAHELAQIAAHEVDSRQGGGLDAVVVSILPAEGDRVFIDGREAFQRYPWPDPQAARWAYLDEVREYLPPGMKLIVCGPLIS
jgi:hypothetical protein